MSALFHPVNKMEETTTPAVSNERAWELICMPKIIDEKDAPIILAKGVYKQYAFHSNQIKDPFTLDVGEKSIELKYTFQTRIYTTVILLRYDYGGSHDNPKENCQISKDDPFYEIHQQCIGRKYIREPHIHVYREGFEDRWAYPVDGIIKDPADVPGSLKEFLKYCAVSDIPGIQRGLYEHYD